MKKLKFTIILILVMTIRLTTAYAQTEIKLTRSEESEMLEQINEDKIKLSITTAQEPEFERITMKYKLKAKEIKDIYRNKKRESPPLHNNQLKKNEEMKNLLSEEQFKIYISWQEPRIYEKIDGKTVRIK
jgi:hypothetical protein